MGLTVHEWGDLLRDPGWSISWMVPPSDVNVGEHKPHEYIYIP